MRELFSLVLMTFFLSSLSCGGQEKVSYLVFEDGLSYDFGKAREEGDELVHSYRFTNASKDTVTITNINVYCKCTRAAASARTFLPGEHGEIRVGFSPYGYPGKISKSVRVTTEPKSDFLLTFSADIIPRQKPVEEEYPVLLQSGLRLDRTDFNFGRITAGQSKSMSIRCINTSAVPLSIDIGDIITDRPGDGSHIGIWHPGMIRPGEKAEIVLTYSPERTVGETGFRKDGFSLRATGYPDKAEISAEAAVVEDFSTAGNAPAPAVSISNSYVNLDEVPAGPSDRTVSYTIRNIGKAPLVIRDIDCPDGLECSLLQGLSLDPGQTNRFSVTVRFGNFPPGKFFMTVRIMTNDPVRPVKDLMISAKIVE